MKTLLGDSMEKNNTLEAKKCVIADAGPLIHLDELDIIDLLSDFGEVLVPESVLGEVMRHRPKLEIASWLYVRQVRKTIDPKIKAIMTRYPIHVGELDALNLAMSEGNVLFLTDDTAARLAAQSLNIEARGTVGIILRAIRRNLLTKTVTIQILESIPHKSTLHLSRTILFEVIQSVKDYQQTIS